MNRLLWTLCLSLCAWDAGAAGAWTNMNLVVTTNGRVVAPTNFFYENSNAINAVVGATSGGPTNGMTGDQVTNTVTALAYPLGKSNVVYKTGILASNASVAVTNLQASAQPTNSNLTYISALPEDTVTGMSDWGGLPLGSKLDTTNGVIYFTNGTSILHAGTNVVITNAEGLQVVMTPNGRIRIAGQAQIGVYDLVAPNIAAGSSVSAGTLWLYGTGISAPTQGSLLLVNSTTAGNDVFVVLGTNSTATVNATNIAYPRINRVGAGITVTSQDGVQRSSNTITAAAFIGDGSQLTNITVSSTNSLSVSDSNALVAVSMGIGTNATNFALAIGVAATNGQNGSVLATNLSAQLNGAGTTATNALTQANNAGVAATNLQATLNGAGTTATNALTQGQNAGVAVTNLAAQLNGAGTTATNALTQGNNAGVAVTNLQSSTNWSVIIFGDTQEMTTSDRSNKLYLAANWVNTNWATLNAKVWLHVGDVVNSASDMDQWFTISNALSPAFARQHLITRGNHDLNAMFTNSYGYYHYTNYSWWSGMFRDTIDSCQFLTINGDAFGIISIDTGQGPELSSEQIAWVGNVIATNKHRRFWILTHDSVTPDNGTTDYKYDGATQSSTAAQYKDLFCLHPQIEMVFCGHWSEGSRFVWVNQGGKAIRAHAFDLQSTADGGAGYIHLLTFKPSVGQIDVVCYSPSDDTYKTNSNLQYSIPINNAFSQLIADKEIRVVTDTPSLTLSTQTGRMGSHISLFEHNSSLSNAHVWTMAMDQAASNAPFSIRYGRTDNPRYASPFLTIGTNGVISGNGSGLTGVIAASTNGGLAEALAASNAVFYAGQTATNALAQANNAGVSTTNLSAVLNGSGVTATNALTQANNAGIAATNGQNGSVLATNLSATLNGAGVTATNALNATRGLASTNISVFTGTLLPAQIAAGPAQSKIPSVASGATTFEWVDMVTSGANRIINLNGNGTNVTFYGSTGATNWTKTDASGWLNTNSGTLGYARIASGNIEHSGTMTGSNATYGKIKLTNNVEFSGGTYNNTSSNIVVDMSRAIQELWLTNQVFFNSTTNRNTNGWSCSTFIIYNGDTARNLYFNSSWHWYGTTNNPPTALAAGKSAILSLMCNGYYETNIHAGFVAKP